VFDQAPGALVLVDRDLIGIRANAAFGALAELAEGAASQLCGVCVQALFAVLARG